MLLQDNKAKEKEGEGPQWRLLKETPGNTWVQA